MLKSDVSSSDGDAGFEGAGLYRECRSRRDRDELTGMSNGYLAYYLEFTEVKGYRDESVSTQRYIDVDEQI